MHFDLSAETSALAIKKNLFLPWDIIDEILVHTRNPMLAVLLKRFSIARQIDKKTDSNWAIRNEKLEYLMYLNERGQCKEYENGVFTNCGKSNNINIFKYCHESIKSIASYSKILDGAIIGGHIDLLDYLYSIGCESSFNAITLASKAGHIEVLNFWKSMLQMDVLLMLWKLLLNLEILKY